MPDSLSRLPRTGSSATAASSAVQYRLGGRTYPMRSEPRCKVCQSPSRMEIERNLIRSYGPTAIHRSLPPQVQEKISVRNIADHAAAHLPVDHTIRQAAVRARAQEMGMDFETAEGALVDHIVFAKTGLQQVYERLVDGEIRPDVQDGIAFARLLLQVEERAGGGMDEEVMGRAFMAYMRAMRQVCTPEQVRAMSNIIREDPIMQALLNMSERVEAREIEGVVVEEQSA